MVTVEARVLQSVRTGRFGYIKKIPRRNSPLKDGKPNAKTDQALLPKLNRMTRGAAFIVSGSERKTGGRLACVSEYGIGPLC